MFLGQEFCHGATVTLGQKAVLAAGIGALLNSDRLIKPFPKCAVVNLFFARQRRTEVFYRHNAGTSLGIEQQFLMVTVVNEEGLIGVPTAEMMAQQREYPVFGLNFRA